MIKYIGSKRVLVPRIVELVRELGGVRTALDLFSGTARVGHALKAAGVRVTANDHLAYAHALARCYVQADGARVRRDAERLVAEYNAMPGRPGWFTATYCEDARYLHPKNGARVEAIREDLARRGLEPDLEAVLLVSLMEAADRVDSTVGLQMAYLKTWAARAHGDLALRVPDVLDGPGVATLADARDAAAAGEFDLVYADPPYNQHKYLGNYHVWETLVRWDRPEVYGVARKRVDCRDYRSPYNSTRAIHAELRALFAAVRARHLVVSFNDEGHVSRAEMEALLGEHGSVTTIDIAYKRHVGAKIGIYNPAGEKVGTPGRLSNREFLFVVSERPELGPLFARSWRAGAVPGTRP
jgi:adenine-specific DNA-methyltransferase